MNRFLIVLILIVAGVIGVSFYMKWVYVASDGSDDKVHINITVDKDKIQEDEKKTLEKVQDLGHQVKDKDAVPAGKPKDQTTPAVEPPRNEK